jgi:hypothetical protein
MADAMVVVEGTDPVVVVMMARIGLCRSLDAHGCCGGQGGRNDDRFHV